MEKRLIFLTIMLFAANLLSGSGKAKAENLIANPGFEASPANPVSWIITGPVEGMQPLTTIDNKVLKFRK